MQYQAKRGELTELEKAVQPRIRVIYQLNGTIRLCNLFLTRGIQSIAGIRRRRERGAKKRGTFRRKVTLNTYFVEPGYFI